MIAPELALPLSLAVPLIGFIAIWRLDKAPNLREAATLITGVVLLALVVSIFAAVGAGERPEVTVWRMLGGLSVSFHAEPLGAMFALIASGLWIVNSVYSVGYMRGANEKNQTRFYMCFAIAIGAAMGVAFAANLFTLFIFYEVLTLSTFPLVTHKGDDDARRGGRVYLGVLMATSIGLLLPAIVWTYAVAETTDFTPGGIFSAHADAVAPFAGVLLGLYAFGVGKAALMPMHSWLPNAMVAPTPVSAFLHAVAVVKAGVFSILKIAVYVFGIDFLAAAGIGEPFMWLAAISILLASAIAMNKDNLKARLAYSTVSQLSYVTLGAMLATSMGVMGAGVQIAAHALGKMTLFMCAGAIYVAHKKTLVSQLDGMGRVMPITFAAYLVGAVSIIGLPPLGGSWPKFFLMLGAADAGQIAMIAVLMISSLLNIVYLLPVSLRAFYAKPPEEGAGGAGLGRIREAPLFCLLPLIFTALGSIVLFFMIGDLAAYLEPIAQHGAEQGGRP